MADIKDFQLEKMSRDPNLKIALQIVNVEINDALIVLIEAMERFKSEEICAGYKGYTISISKDSK